MAESNNKQNNTINSLAACDPALNATVSASAGSGKTWLLISRIVRLLLDGAEPGNIIALTFTRKAAGEMQIRLNQRLYEMATASDSELDELLDLIGCDNSNKTKVIAAGLYEKLMHSLYAIRIQTFHSFCQDILSRFPLEADIPPGFDLIEDTSLLERQAWQTLFDDARRATAAEANKNQLNEALDTIMQFCNGPDNTYTALHSFLSHRSDWWAYSHHRKQAVSFAGEALAQALAIKQPSKNKNLDPVAQFLNDNNRQKLEIFANLLREIKNKSSEKHAAAIDSALKDATEKSNGKNTVFTLIKSAFVKKDGEKLIQGRQHNATLEKKLGADRASQFIDLHHEIAENIQQVSEQIKRLLTLKINKAWYFAGHHYVEIFQQLKREMRLLDFTDLEWKCYQLLQHADNAHWVQYKIDQRIDHILIDEFQDTNPTQWHLLAPLLDEIAANPEQRPRSVFLVGDEKQSIYSFRRANPALQAQASLWLADNLNARATPLDFSRRSSSAIIHCVNHIFEQDTVKAVMDVYTTHDTHLNTLPGKVLLCDLFTEDEDEAEAIETSTAETMSFRNPLQQPREDSVKTLRHKEADYIAQQILQLKQSAQALTDNGKVRPIAFGDIIILMRNRTHIAIYEDTLKHYGIPFIGNKKGGLLDNLEIQDLNCLLNTLITPYNNLALAQLLKSPIFNASDEELIYLAQQNTARHWYERLLHITAQAEAQQEKLPGTALQRAAALLPRWKKLAEQLPVHDCLDKIFSEGNIIKRYVAANRDENKQKVASNCQRFLELSLETDSGRYPSITRFLQRLHHLETYSENPPEEPLSQSNESRVRLMTIHGSKGLEAPVIFLADCNSTSSNKNAYASLVRWPAAQPQPVNFQLQLSKEHTDNITQKLQQEKLGEQAREELNLLYVALTRAREQLYISGISGRRQMTNSWYQIIASGLQDITAAENTVAGKNCRVYKHLAYPPIEIPQAETTDAQSVTAQAIDQRLLKPIDLHSITWTGRNLPMIAPSLISENHNQPPPPAITADKDQDIALWRGSIIHRVLEQLCNKAVYPADQHTVKRIQQQLQTEVARNKPVYINQLSSCVEEAVTTYNHVDLAAIFNPAPPATSYNEMPLMYKQAQQGVYGFVDRIIRTADGIKIIDYKSHQISDAETMQTSALAFARQLAYYREGIKKLWPHDVKKPGSIKTGVLFTRYNKIVWLE